MEQPPRSRYLFGDFELDAGRRLLLKDGEPVALNNRSFELLLALVSRGKEVVTKDELLSSVWDGQFVEEGNLTVHISALRKALGESKGENKYIVTVPGRGYSFVAETTGPEGGEIVRESHTLEHIVIEEEISDDGSRSTAAQLTPRPSNLNPTRIAIGIVAGAIILGTGYFMFARFGSRRSPVSLQQTVIKRLTTIGIVGTAALSKDGKLFAYTAAEGDKTSLWLGHVDGGESVQVRPPADEVYLSLRFAPDGGSIYYTVSENFGDGTLYRIPAFGGVPEKIHTNFRTLTFAPDGKRMGYVGYNPQKNRIVLMASDLDGGNEQDIAELPTGTGGGWRNPAWSPDGQTIAVSAAINNDVSELYAINLSDGAATKIPGTTWRRVDALSWDKGGNGLVVAGIEKNAAAPQMFYVPFPTGEAARLTNDLSEYASVVSTANDNSILTLQGISQSNIWLAPANDLSAAKQITFGSPGRKDGWDGLAWTTDSRIVYTSANADGTTLWIMNADGTKARQMVPNGGNNVYPSVSADGRTIVFQSNRSGHFAAWRCDADGQNLVQLTGDGIAGQPFISPDGNWVVYNAHLDSNGELSRIPAAGGDPVRLGEIRASWAQISPDSKLLAGAIASEKGTMIGVFSLETGEVKTQFPLPRLANLRLGVHWTPDGRAITYRDWTNGIWLQDLDGNEAKRLNGLPEEKIYSYAWSPDGRLFAFTRGTTTRDVVLITGAIKP